MAVRKRHRDELHVALPVEIDVIDLLSLHVADGFLLDTLSVYMLDHLPCTLLHRTPLTGRS